MNSVLDFQKMKNLHTKISVVTCYDYWSAKIIAESDIDCILVGDSASMVMHGYSSTVFATVEMMVPHIRAVAKATDRKFIIGDLPFGSYRKGIVEVMNAVEKFMRAGAHAVKLEGLFGNEDIIKHLINSGVPVMGHLGFTPQSIHRIGGCCVQGKDQQASQQMVEHALSLEDLGCFAIVLECIPANLAKIITDKLIIPTIGIGAGPHVSGQVLVLQDLLGMNNIFKPKFLKTYLDGYSLIKNALNEYDEEVKAEQFPSVEHCYDLHPCAGFPASCGNDENENKK